MEEYNVKHDVDSCKILNCYECFKIMNTNMFKDIFTEDSIFNVFKKDNETKEEFVIRVIG